MSKAGRPFYYPFTPEELEQKIDSYFQMLRDNPTVRGGPSDFLSYVGMDNKQAIEITKKPPGGYEKHSKLMVKAATLMRAHLETSPAWANGNSSKAIFLTKQPLWDGLAYTDRQDINANTNSTVKIQFGSGRARKKAEEEAFD